jgi:hypothetical protein
MRASVLSPTGIYNYYMGLDALTVERKCPERSSCRQFCICSFEDPDPICRDYYPLVIKQDILNYS